MRVLIFGIWVLLLALLAPAEIGPIPGSQNLMPVFERADLVCSCVVEKIEAHGHPIEINDRPGVRSTVVAQIDIKEAFKFNPPIGGKIRVVYEQDTQMGITIGGARAGLSEKERVLLFLKKQPDGNFAFADPFLGATPFSDIPSVGGPTGPAMLERALLAILAGHQSQDTLRVLTLLQEFDKTSVETLRLAKTFAKSNDPETAIPSVGIILKTLTPDAVNTLAVYLDSQRSISLPISVVSLGSELGRVTDPDALPTLEKLANSEVLSIRYGAMDAIRRIKSPNSVPFLIKQLDDADSNVKYVALISLAEIVSKFDGDYAPGMGPFEQNPDHYIALWKKWWQDEGKARYGRTKPD